jgi:NADH:ubiquinone oxidoreductase subunit 6 (subunit J)
MLFLNVLGTKNFSIALISFAGSILFYSILLISAGQTFIGATLALIYAGAILVLILFILILVNQDKFQKKINISKQINVSNFNFFNNLMLFFIVFKLISKTELANFNHTVIVGDEFNNIENLTQNTFWFFNNSELFNLSEIMFNYNSVIFIILGIFISIISILLLSILKKLY